MAIIGKVTWTPQQPKAGQSIKVDVCDSGGKPYDNKESSYIGINGVAGSAQYLQFAFAGDFKIVVGAIDANGKIEQSTQTITVAAPDQSDATKKVLSDPGNRAWSADQVAWFKTVNDVRLLNIVSSSPLGEPYKTVFRLSPLSTYVPSTAVKQTATSTAKPAPTASSASSSSAAATTYLWDFGDGSSKVKTTSATATHDYSAAMGTADEYRPFHVSVTATSGTDNLGTWTRTVTLHNAYVACKKQGYVVLAMAANGWARKTSAHFVATAEIENPEAEAITFGSRVVIPIADSDDTTPAPSAAEKVDPPITVPAKGKLTIPLSVPFTAVPADSAGFAVIFTEAAAAAKGSALAGLKVRATGYFRLAPRPAVKKTGDKSPKDKSGITAGDPCDPDNLPDNIPDGFVCQVTKETQTVGVPARFLNARKGDVVLCPSVGTSSLVDGIFAQLVPPQQYGHTGIMTRDYEQITHCTASQDRMASYGEGNLLSSNDDGLDPDVLKYGWPGTITESVDKAVNGDEYTDPASSTKQQYQLQSFNGNFSALPSGSALTRIPPRVVKPDPVLETAAVRKTLTDVADDAFANTGKFHYRFYVFTDAAHAPAAPQTGLDAPSTWAAGTQAGVCSAFVWKMMKGRGVHAVGASANATQSELSSYATGTLGLQVAPDGSTEDGLFYYDVDQRTVCGFWLWQQIYNLVAAQAGSFGEWLTGAGGYYANQICNAFAADAASLASSSLPVNQPWLSPGGGSAISPSNFLAWIGPDKGGVLGYSEPMSYEPTTVATVPVYKWGKVTQYGKVSGTVTRDGKPVEHVTITVPGQPGLQAGTDKDGKYTLDKVAYGSCLIKAMLATEAPTGATVDSIGQVRLDVDKASQDAPEIKLRAAKDKFIRTVAISGHCSLDCSEWDWGSNHTTAWPELAGQVDVGLGHTYDNSWNQTETSKDATAVLSATMNYNDYDDSVDVTFTAALDQPGGRSLSYSHNIAPGKSYTFVIGDKNSWLNGTGPDKWTYDGVPDLEAKNDTLCCSVTFTNNEWVG